MFAVDSILSGSAPARLRSFSAVLDDGSLSEDINPDAVREASYACGLFEFTK